jgi:hypothetical protein
MSPQSRGPANRPVMVALCLMLACAGMACLAAAEANAAHYKMLLCAGNNGSNSYQTATNTISPATPGGIFNLENLCGPASDPAGNGAFLRIAENQASGTAGVNAYGSISWTAPHRVAIIAGGGYTRMPHAFNDGWRGRFWAEDMGGGGHNILMQGAGVSGGGIYWGLTSTFASHLWPFGGYGDYRRFIFEMTCFRQAGCDRSGFNAVDANTIVLMLADREDSQVAFTNGSALMGGGWVRGTQAVTWNASDQGSGLRFERLRVDGSERHVIDHRCDLGHSGPSGEFARKFQPCQTGGPYDRSYALDTASVPDGEQTVQVCAQDYAQAIGLDGTGSQSCTQRTIRVDNTAPGAPLGLQVTSPNPHRYLDRFGARFTLPPNAGSPIAKVHYEVVDAAGKVVKPARTLSATNPTELSAVEGPPKAGGYLLRVWLQDAVGLLGAASTVPIPRDTTPPAAPQGLTVTSPETSRSSAGFDVRWQNIPDAGSPIEAAHYEVLNRAGAVVVPTTTLKGESISAIEGLETPKERGSYTLRLWLSDSEGNVGAPVSAPLAYECVRSEAKGGLRLSAGFGNEAASSTIVPQKEGTTLSGQLGGRESGIADAPLCVFSRVITDAERQFVGIAMTGHGGEYRIDIGAGPSRELDVVYRPDQRELSASAILRTRVRPTFRLVRKVVRNKGLATFAGEIPGPRNDKVVVVLQVKSGKAWRVFRRYRTRVGGRYVMRYRFTQTATPTVYVMRAQVRAQSGYPYEQGNSQARRLRVVPVRP